MSNLIAVARPDADTAMAVRDRLTQENLMTLEDATVVERRQDGVIKPGTAPLFLLIVRSTPDKAIPQTAQYGDHIVQTSLSHEEQEQLRATAPAAKAGA